MMPNAIQSYRSDLASKGRYHQHSRVDAAVPLHCRNSVMRFDLRCLAGKRLRRVLEVNEHS
jgi:hypothetical protein